MRNQRRTVLMVIATAVCMAVPCSAQLLGTLPTPTSAECDTIAAAASARPFVHDTLVIVVACPSHFGSTMSGLMSTYSLASSHPSTYGLLFTIVSQYRNPSTLDEALDIAVDASAPLLARTWAVITMLNYRFGKDRRLSGSDLASYSGPVEGCALPGSLSLGGSYSGFPSSWYEDIDEVAATLVNSAAPLPVRHLATCILEQLKAVQTANDMLLVPATNYTFNPSTDFSYVKQCGRKFLLRNASYVSVSVLLIWADTYPGNRFYVLPPRKEGESYSEVSWTVPGSNSYAGVGYLAQSLMTETPNNTPC